jgi:hypothetical protein
LTIAHLLHYPLALPDILGWPLCIAAGLGGGWMLFDKKGRTGLTIFACWAVFFYFMAICISWGDERYAYSWAPPFAVLGSYGLVATSQLLKSHFWAIAILLAFVVPAAVTAAQARPPIVSGHEEAARFVGTLDGGSSVLVDSYWDGEFVFYSHEYDRRHRIVLRGSKVLYTYATFKSYGYTEFVHSPNDILELLRKYGVRYIVVDMPDSVETAPGEMLRELVKTERFRRLARIPVVKDRVYWKNTQYLEVYEFPEGQRLTAREIELHFPGLSPSVITVPLNQN